MTLDEYDELIAKKSRGEPLDDRERMAMEKTRFALETSGAVINTAIDGLGALLGPVARAFLQARDGAQLITEEIAAYIAEVPATMRSASVALAHQGWYLDPENGLSHVRVYEQMIEAGDLTELDEEISSDIEKRLNTIESYLVGELPRRARILHAAFRAHRAGDFDLSVPALLIQADGACYDALGGSLFMRQNGSLEVAARIRSRNDDEFTSAATAALHEKKLPIAASRKEREYASRQSGGAEWPELNRHLVLHGESVDYGTRINSLKAISLLTFIVGFVSPR